MSAMISISCLKQMFDMATSIKDGHLRVPQLRPREMDTWFCTSSRDTYECSNQIRSPNLPLSTPQLPLCLVPLPVNKTDFNLQAINDISRIQFATTIWSMMLLAKEYKLCGYKIVPTERL